MKKETAAAACQVLQTEKKLQMERSIEAARVAQLRIIEQQIKMRPNKELKERLTTFKNEMLHTLEKAKNRQKGKENMRPNDKELKELKEQLATFRNEMLHMKVEKNKQKGE